MAEHTMEIFFLTWALGVATAGALQDVRSRRIPNWLTYSGLVLALLVRFAVAGWPGFRSGLAGAIVGGGIFFLLFLVGGMGGGDVKLMAAVGAWAGSTHALLILIATAIFGGILGVSYMLFRGQVFATLSNTVELMRHHLTSGLRPHPVLNIQEPGALRIPYGLAIALGTLYCAGNVIWRG
jgi:prepilin peptidase CpaA